MIIKKDSHPLIQLFIFFILGILLGIIAKYTDTISANGFWGNIGNTISDITTRLGIWIVLASLIAFWSNRYLTASLNVFAFLMGMLISYYIYSQILFGFFPTYYFVAWGTIAVLSPIASCLIHFGKRDGWLSALCLSLPIGLLLSSGYPILYLPNILFVFDLFGALILFFIFVRTRKQKLPIILCSIIVAIIFIYVPFY